MEDDYEKEFMRLVSELMMDGLSQQEAIEAARDELDRLRNKFMADGGRVNFEDGGGVSGKKALKFLLIS